MVWILSHTPIAQEPRVIRQAWSLARAGWRVVVAGYVAGRHLPDDWRVLPLDALQPRRTLAYRLMLLAQRRLGKALYRRFSRNGGVASLGARLHYFGFANWREDAQIILASAKARPDLRPSLVIAHDYDTCPPALSLAESFGAALIVDCHEYARGQYEHDDAWRSDGRLFATAMQDHYLARADAVTTVSAGIAERLTAEQILKRPVLTLRSMPFHEAMPFRPAGETTTILYHGLIAADRGLEALVTSVRDWRPGLRLVLRGHGDPDLVETLKAIAVRDGVAGRIAFEPSVPFAQIVAAANEADIGYFVQPDGSPQKRFTLPNKFFEYTMAGLAVVVSDLPEMAGLVRLHGHGRLVAQPDPALIAKTLNSLSPAVVNDMKRKALAAARELCWDREEEKFLTLVEELAAARSARAGQ